VRRFFGRDGGDAQKNEPGKGFGAAFRPQGRREGKGGEKKKSGLYRRSL
jgi:hypothetical protein